MQTVVEMPTFKRQADKLFTEDERQTLAVTLSCIPFAGDEIPGTGGVRKLRVAAKSKGKRGGARVIYYVYDLENPILLLHCYGKNEQLDITDADRMAFRAFTTALKAAFRGRKKP